MPTPDKEAQRRRFETVPDFIAMKRFGYSLARCEERYPVDEGGLQDDKAVAQAAALEESQVQIELDRIAGELRHLMNVQVEEPDDYRTPMLWLMLAPILPPGTLED